MRASNGLAVGLLVVAVVLAAHWLEPSLAQGESKGCADVVIRTGDGSVYTRTESLRARGVSCRVARAVAHVMLSFEGTEAAPPRPRGFECDMGSPAVCRRGSDRITWRWPRGGARAAAAPRVPRLLKSDHGLYRPHSYCPSNHTCFSRARWLRWTQTAAVARATGRTYYPGAAMFTERVRLRFDRPEHVCGGWYFTHVKWRYSGDRNATEASLLTPVCLWTGA
jgi:hypothetical protein